MSSTSPDLIAHLSGGVSLYGPSSAINKNARSDISVADTPRVVLLLGWVAANETHLIKYVQGYRAVYPSALIILIRARVFDMCFPQIARQRVRPAAYVIQREAQAIEGSEAHKATQPWLLVHIFSNGGSRMLAALYQEFARISPAERKATATKALLPLHPTIFDSAPSMTYDHKKIVFAIVQGIRSRWLRIVMLPLIHLIASWFWFQIRVLRFSDTLATWASNHNHKSKILEVRRTYIYGDEDEAVLPHWIEAHAADASAKGFDVRMEMFKGSPHVAHMRTDPERYWKIVRETWRGGPVG